MTHDLIVIGAGQGGVPLASAFARAGRHVVLVERAEIGGTCVNTGCTPSKTMAASARMAWLARRAGEVGVNVKQVAVNLARVRERKRDVVRSFREGSTRSLERSGVEIVRGHARFTGSRSVEVQDSSGMAHQVSADVIVIDTGTRPAIARIPGVEHTPFLDSTSIMELDQVPEHLVVLGGGSVGLEFAQMFRRFGSRVTVLERAKRLLPAEDDDIAEAVRQLLAAEGIEIIPEAEPTRMDRTDGGVILGYRRGGDDAAGEATITGTRILFATGRVPNTDQLNPEAAGVDLDERGYVKVNRRLETTAPGIYALGDVTGEPGFTHVSYDDYRILRTNLLEGEDANTDGRILPYTVYIDPQLGRVGLTEQAARKGDWEVAIAKLPMASVARAIEVNETRGLMKAVIDAESGRLAEALNNLFRKVEGSARDLALRAPGRQRWEKARAG